MRERSLELVVAWSLALAVVAGCAASSGSDGDDGQDLPVDRHTPLSALSAAQCLALCDRVGAEARAAGVEEPCLSPDECPSFCAAVPNEATRPCPLTAGELADCLRAASSRPCRDFLEIVDEPACAPLFGCLLLPDTAPVRDIDQFATRILCARLMGALAPGGVVAEVAGLPDRDECLAAVLEHACRCNVEVAEASGCDLTVGDLLGCVAAASPGALPADPGCAPFVAAEPPACAPDDPLVALGCARTRRLCEASIPEQGDLPESAACPPREPGRPGDGADYRAAVETCVASVGSLRCHCARTPGAPGCDGTVADLQACVAGSYVGGCAYLGGGECIAPGNGPSGLAEDRLISAASEELLAAWCDWRVCLGGGTGFVGNGCPEAAPATRVPDVAGCVADLRTHFTPCPVTLADVERCLLRIQRNDACERLNSFGACTSVEDPVLAYVPCHYVAVPPECGPVRQCLEDVWDVGFVPPPGY